MKNILILLIALFAISVSADTTIVNTSGLGIVPQNVSVIQLFDGVADTVEDSTFVTWGPYRMAADRNENAYKGYQFYSAAMTGTSPTAALAYQLTLSSDTADIVAGNWVTTDTLAETGSTDYVDLSSKSAKFIYFRYHNYDATSNVVGKLEIGLKKDN
jgi:hypothetical protein